MDDSVNELFKDGYTELLKIARARLATEQAAISTITLAHELYINLRHREDLRFPTRAHFFAYSSRAMRSLLTDMARERISQKRSAQLMPLTVGLDVADVGESPEQLVALDKALHQLAQVDPRLEQVAEMRVIMGMEVPDVATAMGTSEATVKRDWQRAKAFLLDVLEGK